MPGRMPRRVHRADPRDDLVLALDEIVSIRFGEGDEVVREIAAGRTLVRVGSELVLALLNDVFRINERWTEAAVRFEHQVAAGMIEVQVGVDDERDVFRTNAKIQ